LELDVQVADSLFSKVWAVGDSSYQAAVFMDHFSEKVKLPYEWGEKADTSKEAILSIVSGKTPQEIIKRQHSTRPMDRHIYGSHTQLRQLYRALPYIQARLTQVMAEREIPQGIIWRSVKLHPQTALLKQLKDYTVEIREGEPVYIIKAD